LLKCRVSGIGDYEFDIFSLWFVGQNFDRKVRRIQGPPGLASSKNIVMPILFRVEGSKMFRVVILVEIFAQILFAMEHAL
jgi:hypothetical protein